MKTYSIPILQYNLYDIPLKDNFWAIKKVLEDTIKLVKSNKEAFKDIENAVELFHNQDNKYSSIQFASVNGSLSITAYGAKETKALRLWLKVFKKQNSLKPKNYQEIKEKYILEFLKQPQTYRVRKLLVGRKAKDFPPFNEKGKFKKRMEDYIRHNFEPFYNHLGYYHDYDKLKVTVDIKKKDLKEHPGRFKVFNDGNLKGYDIIFKTNLKIPHLFRFCQSTSLGYGVVTWL